jgi:hypothetical protein
MIVTAHQPHYLPWIGYVNRIHLSDNFVVMDNLQYEQNNYLNRNRIIGSSGILYLTIPVNRQKLVNSQIKDVLLSKDAQHWQIKHLKSLKNRYSRGLGFDSFYPELERILKKSYRFLIDLDFECLKVILNYLNITTNIIMASNIDVFGKKENELIISILDRTNSNSILLGIGGSTKYIEQKTIINEGYMIQYQEFEHPVYQQFSNQFYQGISVIDLLLMVSQKDAEQIVKTSGKIKI